MDGWEVVQQIRALRPDVPILLMSGYTEQELIGRFAGVGVSGFLQKPFRPDDLINRVSRMLGAAGRTGIE
jgi:CheY-like chemotaxis protein